MTDDPRATGKYDDDKVITDHAERCQTIIDAMRDRLGDDYFGGHGDVAFELTPKGRSTIHYRDLQFFLSDVDGGLVAARTRGGRAEFADISTDGEWLWTYAPLAPEGVN